MAPDPPYALLRLWSWAILAMAVALVHNRLWASPNLDAFAKIAADWGNDPFSSATSSDYLLTNLSLPTLARVIGMTRPHQYALLHLGVMFAGSAACVAMAMRRFGYRTARTLVVLLAAPEEVLPVVEALLGEAGPVPSTS